MKVSTPLLSSDTGPRTEWCDVLVALLRGLAADAGPEARFVFPLAWREWEVVPGCSDDAQCFGNYSHSFLGV